MPDPYVMNDAIAGGMWDAFGVIALGFCIALAIAGTRKR